MIDHVNVSPTDGIGPTQGQRKTLTRVGKKLQISTSHYTLIQFVLFFMMPDFMRGNRKVLVIESQ